MHKFLGTPLKTVVIVTVAATSLSLAACDGGSDKSSSSTNASVGASSTNASVGASATPTPSFPFEKGTVDKKKFVDSLADGVSRMKTYHFDGIMSMRMNGESRMASVTGDVDMSNSSSTKTHTVLTRLEGAKSSQRLEMVSVNGKTYVKKGSKWQESTEAEVQTQQMNLNPVTSIRENEKYINEVRYAGEEASDHRFVVTVDPKKMPNDVGAYIKDAGYTYWTDDSMRLVRMDSVMSGTGGQTMSVEMKMSKFDEPVSIPKVS